MTVFRAMHELQTQGIVVRRVGSGTFVAQRPNSGSYVFGLLIPELGQTEIFEVICKGMMEAPQATHHSLLWGNAGAESENEKEEVAEQLCRHYIAQRCQGFSLHQSSFHQVDIRQITELFQLLTGRASPLSFWTDASSRTLGAAITIWSESTMGEPRI